MAQNRGPRRDNRMYRSNYGGGGRPSGHVSPWEGGIVPGGGVGGGHRAGGLLPTPVPQTSNLLSQLSTTEAQLAIASNLLTTLLRPQQQQQQQAPPLLNLGSLGHLGGSGLRLGHGGGRFQDGGPMRRRRMDGRRSEPYGKMGNRSRDMHPMQGRRPPRGGGERKPGNHSSFIGKGRGSGQRSGRTEKKDDKERNDKESADDKEEDSTREDGDKKKEEDGDEDEEEEKFGEKGKRYAEIPQSLLFCHVCRKHMWDEHSFENHVKGRAHQLMMDKLEESYRIKVELMRHELKVAEQQREIELERMKRQGKKVNTSNTEYCLMCDLQFYGNLLVHRKTARHQKLKTFLHPRCTACSKEFATRVEWDKHRLTPIHLKRTAQHRKDRKPGLDDDDLDIEDFIALDTGNFDDDFEERDIQVRTREDEEEEVLENKARDERDDEKKEADEAAAEQAEALKEAEILSDLPFRIPKYNPDAPVGQNLLKRVTGFFCRVCRRFFLREDDAMKVHCRTLSHYNNYVALLKAKARVAEARERREAKVEAQKNQAQKEGGEQKTKRASDDDGEDENEDSKRRKVAKEENAEKSGSDKEEDEDSAKKADGNKKYDPLEADAEDSMVEADETGNKATQEDGESDNEEISNKEPLKEAGDDDTIWEDVDRELVNVLEKTDGEVDTDEEEKSSLSPRSRTSRAAAAKTRGAAEAKSPAPSSRGRGRRKK